MRREVKVSELYPGDEVTVGVGSLSFVATLMSVTENHPRYPGLSAVAWAFPRGHIAKIKFSFDALSPDQVVGTIDERDCLSDKRIERLHRAVLFLNDL